MWVSQGSGSGWGPRLQDPTTLADSTLVCSVLFHHMYRYRYVGIGVGIGMGLGIGVGIDRDTDMDIGKLFAQVDKVK